MGPEGTEPGATEMFRVRVSLERFFSDERAHCYVSVGGARRVRWLARRLRRLFPRLPRPRRLALLSRGHLLPPDEPLALLRPDDPVEVILATGEVDQISEDKHLATGATIEASTPEPSPDCKKRRKDQVQCHNNLKFSVAMDTTVPLPTSTENCTPEQYTIYRSKEISQEHELSSEPSSDNERRQNNKQPFFYGANSLQTDAARPAATEDILQEQGRIELQQECELSDSERIRSLKERALAVLDQVETRTRRRVRVRRRRKRPGAPGPASVPGPDVPELASARGADGPGLASAPGADGPGPSSAPGTDAPGELKGPIPVAGLVTIAALTETPTRDEAPAPQLAVAGAAGAAEVAWPAGAAGEAGAGVLRNAAAAPRAARLVRPLVETAP